MSIFRAEEQPHCDADKLWHTDDETNLNIQNNGCVPMGMSQQVHLNLRR